MVTTRMSTPADIPAQRELWKNSFVGEDRFLANFFDNYYRPERVYVLEEDGAVRSMTTWFDTTFVVPGRGEFRAAYIYAVATHPDCRGRGFAARLMADMDEAFKKMSIPAVTVVPSEPSLHNYYARSGFRECFVLEQRQAPLGPAPAGAPPKLEGITPEDYGNLREALLAGAPHIRYNRDALAFQAGCSAIAPGGGLYALETPRGAVILCAEGSGGDRLILKELLGGEQARAWALDWLPALLPAWSGEYRVPAREGQPTQWGMLKWLDPEVEKTWDWSSTGYLGLAFD